MADELHLRERIADSLLETMRLVRAASPDPWLGVELTMPQFKVLSLLGRYGPSSVGRLAQALRVTLPTVTGILDRLVEQGLVERYEDQLDRRLVVSRLTPRGAEQLERLESAGRARLRRIIDRLPAGELAGVLEALERLHRVACEEYRAGRGCAPEHGPEAASD